MSRAVPSLLWLRQDLRLADHPALTAAFSRGGPVIPVFIWAPEEEGGWPPGAASRWWLHQSLASLDADLRARQSRLVIRRGPSLVALRELLRETAADSVFWSRRYEPAAVARDAGVSAALQNDGVEVETFNAELLFEPAAIRTRTGKPFQVFTPFWKTCLSSDPPAPPVPVPSHLPGPRRWPASLPLSTLALEPRIDWAAGMRAAWQPGEAGALEQLKRFLAEGLMNYSTDRDRPGVAGISRLSPHLHFGEISPRQVRHAIEARAQRSRSPRLRASAEAYLREIGWREFAYHVLANFPHTPEVPLHEEFRAFPWRDDAAALRAWQRGYTGYPIVDAGMRELWTTGWMHNRVRMIVASFLVKDLLLPWQLGAQWFWDTLVDADLANNTLGWQWVAGCGAAAAPYFRIFNPVSQGEKFDPDGDYVRRWIPELARLPAAWIHRPWETPVPVLNHAGVRLGDGNAPRLVDHGIARRRALQALAIAKRARRN